MNKRVIACCVAGLLTIQAALLTYSAKVHSPTWDEVGHLAAGLSHWEFGRFELYSVNPPLVRSIAAAPVYFFCQPQMDWSYYRSDPAVRSEVYVGRRMIELNGESSFNYFFVARLAVIPIALLGGWLCFLWGRDLFGDAAGLVALTLWTFSPNVLAYGSVITPDIGSSVALIGCCYCFLRWLKDSSWTWSLSLLGALAVAMLTKSVWLCLPFVFAAIWFGQLIWQRRDQSEIGHGARANRLLQLGKLALAGIGAMLLVNAFYGFHGSFRSLGQYEFVSGVMTGQPADQRKIGAANRFSGTMLGSLPVPLPANYLQGIDIQSHDFERGRYDRAWMSYLLGQWKPGGWWYYYLIGLLVKIPLATWLLIGTGTIVALASRQDRSRAMGGMCLWITALVLLVIVSASTGLNRYFRYSLPILPVLFVWASQAAAATDFGVRSRRVVASVVTAAILWLAVSTCFHAPHYLSYFNQIAGGPSSGHQVLCDSNVDWGQDLLYLKHWLREHPSAADSLHLAYFGSYDPALVGIDYHLPDRESDVRDRRTGQLNLNPGWYVISKNYLVGHSMPVPDGIDPIRFRFFDAPVFSYFSDLQPVDRIGHSMLVYRIDHVSTVSHNDQATAARIRVARQSASSTTPSI